MPSSCESLCQVLKQKSWRTSVCSCSNCDSYGCFEVRHQATKMCVCKTCDSPKSCLLIQNQETCTDENVILKQIFSASGTQCDIEEICNPYENECEENCGIDQDNAVCKDVLMNEHSEKISHENKEQYPCSSCREYHDDDKKKSEVGNSTKFSSPQKSYLGYGDKNDPVEEVIESPKVKQTKFVDQLAKTADDSQKNDNVSFAETDKNQPRKERKIYPTDSRMLIRKRSVKSKENNKDNNENPMTCPMAGKKCDKNCSEPWNEDPSLRQKPSSCPGSQKCDKKVNESWGKDLSLPQKPNTCPMDRDFKEYKSEDPPSCQKPVTCLMVTQKCNKDFNESKSEDPPSCQKLTASQIALKNCNNCIESKSQEPVCRVLKSKVRRTELCSCVDCNSFNCFELRYRAAMVCICKTCEKFKSCPLYKRPSTAADSTTPLKQIFSTSCGASKAQYGIPCCNVPPSDQYCDIERLDLISEKGVPITCQTKEVNDLASSCCDEPPYGQCCNIEHLDLISEKEIPMACQTNESNDLSAESRCVQNRDNKISGKINEKDKVCKTCHMKSYNFDGETTERIKNYQAKRKNQCSSYVPEVCSNRNRNDQIDKSLKQQECHDICKEYIIRREKRKQAKREKRKVDIRDLRNFNNNEKDTKSKEQNNKIFESTGNENNQKSKDTSPEQTCQEQTQKSSISSVATKHEEKTENHTLDQRTPLGKSKTCTTDNLRCCDENSTICKYECRKCHTLAAKPSCGNRSPFHSTPVKKYIEYCPAFCPTCHRLYIEEHNEESKKAKVSLKPCPNCRRIIPKTKDTTENNNDLPTLDKAEIDQKNYKSDRKNISPEDLMFTDVAGGTEPTVVQTACKNICFANKNEERLYRQKAHPIRKCRISSFERVSSEEENECMGKYKISNTEKYKEDVDQNKYKRNGVHSASQYHIKKDSASNKDDRLGCCQSLHTDKMNISVRHFKPYNSKTNKSQDDMVNFIKACVRKEIEDIRQSLDFPTNKIDENGKNAKCCSCSTGQSPIDDKPYNPNVDQKPLGSNVAQRNSLAFFEKIKDVIYKEIIDIKDSISKRYETTNKLDENLRSPTLNKTNEERATAKVEDPSTTAAYSTIKDPSTKVEYFSKLPKDSNTTKDECSTFLPRWSTERKKFGSQLIDPKSLTLQTNTCEIKLSVPTSLNYNKNKDHNKINSNSARWGKDKVTTRSEEFSSLAFCTNHKSSSKNCGTADELTAQILSVPLKEYRESAVRQDVKPMRTIELLKMIKDIYQACSCKVCQCIGSSITKDKTEVCSCKPCDCSECRARNNNCVTDANKKTDTSECTCKPCDCIECKADYLIKSCDCKHCQCIDCKSMCIGMKRNKRKYETSFIVAPVRERLQRPYCQCSPCGCFDCAHPYGTVAPTYNSQETGTDERRHMNCNCDSCANDDCEREGADTCTCDTQSKIVKKPVTNTKTDYDIHYVLNKNPNFKSLPKRDPVTIYTSLTHNLFHPHKSRNENACENWKSVANLDYLGYDCSKTLSESMLSHEYWTLRANTAIALDCDCKPCECKKCKKHYLEGHMSRIPYHRGSFFCEICDCIKSATSSLTSDMKKGYSNKLNLSYSTQNCNCQPCKCKDCRKYLFIPYTQDKIRHYEELQDSTTQTNLEEDTSRNNFQHLTKISEPERFIDIVLSHKETRNRDIVNKDPSSTRTQVSFSDSEHLKLYCANMANNEFNFYCNENQSEYDSTDSNTNKMQFESLLYHTKQQSHNEKIILGTKKVNSQISDHLMTDSVTSSNGSSLEHNMDHNKQSNKQDLTTESSCNSSGHDDSQYLIRLPTSTVETCIKDVMSLQTYNKPIKENLEATLPTLNQNKDEYIFDHNTQHNDTMDGKCYNWKTNKSYNRHKYGNKILEFKCRCDCAACRCDNTCLSADSMQKNENSQTTKSTLCSEEEISKSSLLKKLNVTFSNNDRIVRLTDFPVSTIQHGTRSSTTKSDISTINYDSVRRTIKEAKQFSLDLLSILQKYEKANRDFDTITTRFKGLHESVICEADMLKQHLDQSNDYQVAYIKTISKYPSIPGTKKDIICNSNETDLRAGNFESNKPIHAFGKYDKITSKCESPYESQTATKKSDIGVKKFEVTEETTSCDPILNIVEKEADVNKDNLDERKSTEIINQREQVKTDTKTKMITSSTNTTAKSEEKVNLEELKNEYKVYSEHLDKVIDKCRRNQWGIKKNYFMFDSHRLLGNTTIWKNSGIFSRGSSTKEEFNKDCSDFNTVFICGSQRNDDSPVKKEPNILSTQQLDSLKQIILPETKHANITERSEARHQAQMSHTTRDVESQARLCRIFESAPSMALRKLELKLGGTKSTADTSSINYTASKNSYDSMKVVFQTVRKVSDHSILLKWKIPDVTTNIKGYEILVDGRAIQRFLSPSKNMAVLTCLPHAYKVKVTVRTITVTPDGHAPCATVSVCTRS